MGPTPVSFNIVINMLKEITGVRGSTSTDILLAELGLKSLQHVWLLRAAKFWNTLAGKRAGTMYKLIALDCCTAAVVSSRRNWAWSIFRAIRGTGYELGIRVDDMDVIDITALTQHIAQLVEQRDSIWDGLAVCPRTCPSQKARCCTYLRWFARPPDKHARSLSNILASAACMKGLLRFRMACHRLPRDEGSWARPQVPRLERSCRLCATGALGNERHIIFECPELQGFRARWSHLFQGPETMQAFMWQDNLIGIAKFVNMCLNKVKTPLYWGCPHPISLVWLEEM